MEPKVPLRYRIEFAILNAVGAGSWSVLRLLIRGFGPASCPSNHGPRGLELAGTVDATPTDWLPGARDYK
jgi:hypothetical protein